LDKCFTGAKMGLSPSHPDPPETPRPWWREWEPWLLAAMVLAIYLTRIAEPGIRGEESRRAQIGIEMLRTGDWIVPRQQGRVFHSRPPLQNWIIVGVGALRGKVDVWAIRLPSVLSLAAIAVLVYGYARTFLSRTGAFAAGAAIDTVAEVLEQGRLGESEALVILLLGGGLLVWIWAYSRRGSTLAGWCGAYALIALATLAKGLQPPVYFAATVGLYLIWTRRWRDLFDWRHFVGFGVFLLIWGAWQVPFFLQLGWLDTKRMYFNDVALRFSDASWTAILKHWATYPLRVFVCLLPWSVMLFAFGNADFRREIADARPHVLYLVIAVLVGLASMLAAPGASTRYYMALYPCYAVLIGLAVDESWTRLWDRFLMGLSIVMPAAAAAVAFVSFTRFETLSWAQPKGFAAAYLAATLLLAAVTFLVSRGTLSAKLGILAVCAFMGLTYSGAIVNALNCVTVDTPGAVAEVLRRIPPDRPLVSFGAVDHRFTYYFGRPVEQLDWPPTDPRRLDAIEYFCFKRGVFQPEVLPFPWETLAEICCDRTLKPIPQEVTVVARRLKKPAADAQPDANPTPY